MTWRLPVLLAGLGLVLIETVGAVNYRLEHEGGLSYLVIAGGACTVLSGFLPYIGERAWHSGQRLSGALAFLILPAALCTIIFAAIERSGSAMDRDNRTVADQARRIELANTAIADTKAALDAASAIASQECRSGRGQRCQSLEAREREARAQLETAHARAGTVGSKATNPLVSRLVAMFPISEAHVILFEPLALPLTVSLLSIICIAIGLPRPAPAPRGLDLDLGSKRLDPPHNDDPRRLDLTATSLVSNDKAASQNPIPTIDLDPRPTLDLAPRPDAAQPIARRNPGSVSRWMLTAIEPDPGRHAEWGAMLTAYRLWCRSQDLEPIPANDFADDLLTICDRAEIGTRRKAGKVYCVNVRLIAEPALRIAN